MSIKLVSVKRFGLVYWQAYLGTTLLTEAMSRQACLRQVQALATKLGTKAA